MQDATITAPIPPQSVQGQDGVGACPAGLSVSVTLESSLSSLVRMSCPSCGAPVLSENAARLHCQHCGSVLRPSVSPSLAQEEEPTFREVVAIIAFPVLGQAICWLIVLYQSPYWSHVAEYIPYLSP